MTMRWRAATRWGTRLALAALVAGAAGCRRWVDMPIAPAGPSEPVRLRGVEVTRRDGVTMRLRGAELGPDSLRWRRAKLFTTEPAAMPRDSIARLRRRTIDRKRTAWAAVVGVLGVAAMAAGPGSGTR